MAQSAANRRATETRQRELNRARQQLEFATENARSGGSNARAAVTRARERFNIARRARDRQLPSVQARRKAAGGMAERARARDRR